MEYPFIQSVVPEGEHFDSSAVGEGVWMSVNHFNALEARGIRLHEDVATIQGALDSETLALQKANETIAELETRNAEAATSLNSHAAVIKDLQLQIAEHGKKSSGSGTTIAVTGDQSAEQTKVPSYASEKNESNAWIDKRLKAKAV